MSAKDPAPGAASAHSPQRVVLLGGSGQIGLFALPRLLQVGCPVLAVVRDGAEPDQAATITAGADGPRKVGVQQLPVQQLFIHQLSAALSELNGTDLLLLSCGPVGLALEVLQSQALFNRAVIISTSSVHTKQHSADVRERRQIEGIGDTEKAIERLCHSNGTSLVLLRPTLIYGCGMDNNVSAIYRWMQRWRYFPVAANAPGLRQPLHADDLAAVAVAALCSSTGSFVESPVCGGSTLSYREMVDRTGQAAGNEGRGIALPARLLAAAAAVAGRLAPAGRISAGMVWRQAEDLVFDDSDIRAITGVKARKFHPESTDFSCPDSMLSN